MICCGLCCVCVLWVCDVDVCDLKLCDLVCVMCWWVWDVCVRVWGV